MDEVVLRAEGLSKRFAGDTAPVLHGVDFAVRRGEVFAIVGPSGAGKSTLLRLLNALDEPSGGSATVLGRPLGEWPVVELRRRVAMLFQVPTLFEGTVRDNLLLPLRLRDGRATADDGALAERLAQVGLEEALLDHDATTLSVGQQQRVAFVRALMLEPAIILLDEPTASLDPAAALGLLRTLSSASREQGLTVLLVTHQFAHARETADRVMLLIAGEPVATQPTAEFFEQPANARAARFVAGETDSEAVR